MAGWQFHCSSKCVVHTSRAFAPILHPVCARAHSWSSAERWLCQQSRSSTVTHQTNTCAVYTTRKLQYVVWDKTADAIHTSDVDGVLYVVLASASTRAGMQRQTLLWKQLARDKTSHALVCVGYLWLVRKSLDFS